MVVETVSPLKIKELLIEKFLKDPEEGRQIAEENGLWNWLKEWVLHPSRIRYARKDYNAFMEMIFIDPDTMKPVVQQYFQKEWQEMITKFTFSLIAAPRGHGKTTQIAGRAIWELGNNVNKRIKVVGSSEDKAKEIVGMIKDIISNNPIVKEIFPWLVIDAELGDTKEAFFVRRTIQGLRDPSVQASGWSATGAGGRADLLIFDDVVDAKNAIINPAQREQVKRIVRDTWLGLLANNGKVVWICTPYHQADASHDFKSNATPYHLVLQDIVEEGVKINKEKLPWVVWWIPALRYEDELDVLGNPVQIPKVSDKGQVQIDVETGLPLLENKRKKIVLWPDYWTDEKLTERRTVLGERTFARQYLLNAMSDEERTFLESSIRASFDITRKDIGDNIPNDWPTFGGIDLASALSDRGAWTVIWTLAKNPADNKLYLKEMYRKKIKFTQILTEIQNQFDKHKWRFAYVENNGFQKAVEDSADKNMPSIPLTGFTTTAWNKHSQMAGLPGLDTAFAKGLFSLPSARFDKEGFLPSEDGGDLAVFMDELRTHPGGEYSDTIMAFWFAYRAAIEGNSDFVSAFADVMIM